MSEADLRNQLGIMLQAAQLPTSYGATANSYVVAILAELNSRQISGSQAVSDSYKARLKSQADSLGVNDETYQAVSRLIKTLEVTR